MRSVQQHLAALAPASRGDGVIEVGTMASGAAIALPYLVLRGAAPGPCLWINGQVHGNELNGVFAALDFFHGLDPARVHGSVVVTPTANPPALDARQRRTPLDEQDLDQSFPGRAGGLPSQRLATVLLDALRDVADLVISMHCVGPHSASRPYGVYKLHPNGKVAEAELLTLIALFQPMVACHMSVATGSGELPGNNAGALDYQVLALGKPAFMIELGNGARCEPAFVAQAVAGFTGVAARLGMIEAPRAPPPTAVLKAGKRRHLSCRHGGLFRAACAPGDRVAAGQPLGAIIDLYGRTLEIIAVDEPALVISVRQEPVAHSGDRCAFIATDCAMVSLTR
jgi:predicted deacylase